MPRPPRILVVDDDRSQRAIFKEALTSKGSQVVTAGSAQEALSVLAGTLNQPSGAEPLPDGIDLVLLDILMPEVDGNEVLDHIRRAKPPHELAVIMATAKDDPEDIVAALQAGANDYVTKPVNVPVLLARVETQLALRKAHRNLRDAQHSLIHAARMESVGYLAAGVAYEIREPFAEILAGLESLQRSPSVAENELLASSMNTTIGAVERADRVVQGLTRFSAEERLDMRPRDVGQVAKEAIELLQQEFQSADIHVETEFSPVVPAALFATEELRQVLLIVLFNAIDAVPDLGSIKVRTGLRVADEATLPSPSGSGPGIARGDEVVSIEILDNGTGLATDDLLAPFNAFYTTKNTPAAVGLGLTIAKKLMDLQGGLIKIANRDDEEGACVTLSLRRA